MLSDRRTLKFAVTFIISCFTTSLLAEETCSTESDNCVAMDTWSFAVALGIGARTNPLVDGSDIPLVVLPSLSYYGKNFFIDNLDVGYTLIDNKKWMFNLLVTPSYDRLFFERWDINNLVVDIGASSADTDSAPNNLVGDNHTEIKARELKNRKFSLLGGMEISADIFDSKLQLGYFSDLSNVHNGNEIRFAISHAIFASGWNSTLGFSRKDRNLTNYYYGVSPQEVVDDRAAYNAKQSINPFLRLSWKESSDTDNFWRFSMEFQHLSEQITNSPLINKDYVLTAFIGKQYSF